MMKLSLLLALFVLAGCTEKIEERRHEQCVSNDLDQSDEMLKRCMMRSL